MKLSFLFFLFLFSCSKDDESVLKYGMKAEVSMLDPDRDVTEGGFRVMSLIFDKLFDIDEKGSIIPSLAVSYEWKNDYRTLEMVLRKEVTFQDGASFNGEVVEYNLKRSMKLGSDEIKRKLRIIKSIKVTDNIVEINLKDVYLPMLSLLTGTVGMMLSPQSDVDINKKKINFDDYHPVGSGAFSLLSKTEKELVLKKFTSHYRSEEIKVSKIIFSGIGKVGDVELKEKKWDIMEILDYEAVEFETNRNYKIAQNRGWIYYVSFNVGNQGSLLLKDNLLRHALSESIDRKRFVIDGFHEVYNQMVSISSKYYERIFPVPERNLVEAKNIITKLKKTKSIYLSLLISNDSNEVNLAKQLKSMWDETGISIDIEMVDNKIKEERLKKEEYMIVIKKMEDSLNNGMDIDLSTYLKVDTQYTYGKIEGKELMAYVNDAMKEPDDEVRQLLYQKIMRILVEEKVEIFLYNQFNLWGLKADSDGFLVLPDGSFRLYGFTLKQ